MKKRLRINNYGMLSSYRETTKLESDILHPRYVAYKNEGWDMKVYSFSYNISKDNFGILIFFIRAFSFPSFSCQIWEGTNFIKISSIFSFLSFFSLYFYQFKQKRFFSFPFYSINSNTMLVFSTVRRKVLFMYHSMI